MIGHFGPVCLILPRVTLLLMNPYALTVNSATESRFWINHDVYDIW